MDVSVIIVNYNTIGVLVPAIKSIFEQTKDISYELIVVDNNSADNSESIILKEFGKNVIYMALSENIGFGRANNKAAAIAKGKYLFFLNPDTLLLNNSIKTFFDFMELHPEAGICGGNLFDNNLQPMHSYMPLLPGVRTELNTLFGYLPFKLIWGRIYDFNTTTNIREVGYVTGADFFIRKELFEKQNGFDPEFFMYYEETELTHRIKKDGYLVYNLPLAKIIHLEGRSIVSDINRQKKGLASRVIYYKKTKSVMQIYLIDVIFLLKCKLLILFFLLKGEKEELALWRYKKENGIICLCKK
jgi:GT2 family glycosyltransferase